MAAAQEPVADGAQGAGAQILAEALDTTPRTDLAWPAGGTLRADTLATMTAAGVDQLVLAQDAYSDADAAVGRTGRAGRRRVPVDTAGGQLTTLVADSALGSVVAAAADADPGGARAAEQRYLPSSGCSPTSWPPSTPPSRRPCSVVPPREVESDPAGRRP